MQQEEDQTQDGADDQVDDGQGPPLPFDLFHIAASDGAADHDGGGGSHCPDDDLQVLVKGCGDGVGRDGVGTQVAQDGALQRDGDCPEELLHQDLGRQHGKIMADAGVFFQRILAEQTYLLIHLQRIDQDDDQLHDPCNQRADGRSPYSHLRQAEFTENQAVIDSHVDDQGYTGNNECDPHRFRTAERGENGIHCFLCIPGRG